MPRAGSHMSPNSSQMVPATVPPGPRTYQAANPGRRGPTAKPRSLARAGGGDENESELSEKPAISVVSGSGDRPSPKPVSPAGQLGPLCLRRRNHLPFVPQQLVDIPVLVG